MVSLVDTINQTGDASLQKSVYDYLSQQAKDAVAAGVQSGIDSLRSQLLPVLSQLPGATTDGTSAGTGAAGAGAAGAEAHTASTTTLTPELLDQTLRNATEAAYDEPVRVAPRFGSLQEGDGAGEPAAWLQPYATALLTEMWAIEREARAAMAQAEQFEQQVESRVRARLQGEVDREMQRKLTKVQRRLASALGDEAGALREETRQSGKMAVRACGAAWRWWLSERARRHICPQQRRGRRPESPRSHRRTRPSRYARQMEVARKGHVMPLCRAEAVSADRPDWRVSGRLTVAHRPAARRTRMWAWGQGIVGAGDGRAKHLAFGWQPKHAHAHA